MLPGSLSEKHFVSKTAKKRCPLVASSSSGTERQPAERNMSCKGKYDKEDLTVIPPWTILNEERAFT